MSLQKAIEILEIGLRDDVLIDYQKGYVSISFMNGYAHAMELLREKDTESADTQYKKDLTEWIERKRRNATWKKAHENVFGPSAYTSLFDFEEGEG